MCHIPPLEGRDHAHNDGHNFTIITIIFADQARAVVRLAGDVDTGAWPELDDAIHRLADAAPDTVTIDVAAVTYVGSVLPNFLARVRQTVPTTSAITVSRPTQLTRYLLHVTDMAQIAKIDDAVPA
jgi:anti-anti-sigma regulatory factor